MSNERPKLEFNTVGKLTYAATKEILNWYLKEYIWILKKKRLFF